MGKDAALPVRPKVIDGSNRIGIMSLNLNLELSLVHIQPINLLKRNYIPILQPMPSLLHHRDQPIRRNRRNHPRNRVLPILIHDHERGAKVAEEGTKESVRGGGDEGDAVVVGVVVHVEEGCEGDVGEDDDFEGGELVGGEGAGEDVDGDIGIEFCEAGT